MVYSKKISFSFSLFSLMCCPMLLNTWTVWLSRSQCDHIDQERAWTKSHTNDARIRYLLPNGCSASAPKSYAQHFQISRSSGRDPIQLLERWKQTDFQTASFFWIFALYPEIKIKNLPFSNIFSPKLNDESKIQLISVRMPQILNIFYGFKFNYLKKTAVLFEFALSQQLELGCFIFIYLSLTARFAIHFFCLPFSNPSWNCWTVLDSCRHITILHKIEKTKNSSFYYHHCNLHYEISYLFNALFTPIRLGDTRLKMCAYFTFP